MGERERDRGEIKGGWRLRLSEVGSHGEMEGVWGVRVGLGPTDRRGLWPLS